MSTKKKQQKKDKKLAAEAAEKTKQDAILAEKQRMEQRMRCWQCGRQCGDHCLAMQEGMGK